MPLEEAVLEKIEAAVEVAKIEFRELAKENPDAAKKSVAWFKKHKTTATYKHLGKAIAYDLAKELGA